ncbi:hypothetical protein BW723_02230 [Polaribacter reichenbachii]|uniref:Uncharacterized protein n=1 Tax=Polaribacter reichenbachii TaxID=996801 RepID=A0A1B8TWC2_9FLAO|nr:Spy/CpxP family protein refolding chaperone [Polaribacter reichenbachii]APZ48024.1 hypothetical protein BW723_02230 [Polaribacter reichenbachii]AUC20498.1 hypothetical protein BTO17_10230 [Polaribacter reichenbachii]OBY64026.1 hypothetical protein LPB301_13470 [Polaribacter reichenbachii]
MKKLIGIFVLVFVFTLTTQAQKKRGYKKAQMTVEQHTDLAVKRMTLALDLSDKQQNQIKPLIKAQAEERKAGMEKRKEARKSDTKPTADEMYAMQSKRLDAQIAFKSNMKKILNDEQFAKFEKMNKGRKMKGKKNKKDMKERRMAREK